MSGDFGPYETDNDKSCPNDRAFFDSAISISISI